MINVISSAIRRSLDPNEIIKVAVQELGKALLASRCLIYQCRPMDTIATITHEYLGLSVKSLLNQVWPLEDNYLFQKVDFINGNMIGEKNGKYIKTRTLYPGETFIK